MFASFEIKEMLMKEKSKLSGWSFVLTRDKLMVNGPRDGFMQRYESLRRRCMFVEEEFN